jgi:hypothetical protein
VTSALRISLVVVVGVVLLAFQNAHAGTPLAPSALDPTDMQARYNEARATDRAESEAAGAGAQSAGNTGIQWTQWGIGAVSSASELLNSYTALTDMDATCMDLSNTGAPEVPSSCANEGAACGECYTDGVRQLNGMRLNLERLRCYYSAYKRFVEASIAFGDNTSGIHAVTGLAWQNERAGIVAEFDKLKLTYDTKYQQMLPNLRAALEKIGQCEGQYFHNPDWYQRFGYIYFTFMSDRYKRSD